MLAYTDMAVAGVGGELSPPALCKCESRMPGMVLWTR